MVVLTRDDIISGAQKTTEYKSKILGKTVTIRALTDGEYSQIEALKKDMGKITTTVQVNKGDEMGAAAEQATRDLTLELDLKREQEQKFLANCLTAAYGLSIDGVKIRPEDIKGGPSGFAKEVADKVLEFSKLNTPETLKEDVESFRETE